MLDKKTNQLWEKTKKFLNKDRFVFFYKYKVDKWIFQTAMLIFFILMISIAYTNNFDLDYFECKSAYPQASAQCKNPFYEPADWKHYETLPVGEYGTKPNLLFKYLFLSILGIFGTAIFLNHFIYNRRSKNNA